MNVPDWMNELRNQTIGDKPRPRRSNYKRQAVEFPVPREMVKAKTDLILWPTGDEDDPIGFALRSRGSNLVSGEGTMEVVIARVQYRLL